MHDLIRLPQNRGHDANGVFYGNVWDWCVPQHHEEVDGVLPVLLPVRVKWVRSTLFNWQVFVVRMVQPPTATASQEGAWRVGYEQVPPIVQNVFDVTLVMKPSRRLCWQEVTTPSVMTPVQEGIPHSPAILASDQHSHPYFLSKYFRLTCMGSNSPSWTSCNIHTPRQWTFPCGPR